MIRDLETLAMNRVSELEDQLAEANERVRDVGVAVNARIAQLRKEQGSE